ncbi:hypothetical protein ES695_01810 [Candidatus Atribacteria bacterium 1244-E10-H5-B2]|nr:MAG: hypothetical protein ES695_01810 [Candidatus Atribacteria bacterium 1244-E10-H5-B2]
MWRYKFYSAGSTNVQVCNSPCRIKKIALYHTADATVAIHDEVTAATTGSGDAGTKVWTLATKHTTHAVDTETIVDVEILKDEIDFGDKGVSFNLGCHIDRDAGEVLVVYKY